MVLTVLKSEARNLTPKVVSYQKYKYFDSVEALKKRFSVKMELWNGETVYVTCCKFSTC